MPFGTFLQRACCFVVDSSRPHITYASRSGGRTRCGISLRSKRPLRNYRLASNHKRFAGRPEAFVRALPFVIVLFRSLHKFHFAVCGIMCRLARLWYNARMHWLGLSAVDSLRQFAFFFGLGFDFSRSFLLVRAVPLVHARRIKFRGLCYGGVPKTAYAQDFSFCSGIDQAHCNCRHLTP